ncbi:MAG: aminotransferase class V-fold PLP-dependent enzyme [Endomicrobium sp.]|jgi:dTDP-4-amino-4,6-dideoxygalactose transaminase|nr:aminotransferase class V-fold PLP-dependent enzyme [Endomicrobium sp.]
MEQTNIQPRKIKIRTVNSGPAGNLSFIESSKDLPFSIKRVYYLYDLNKNFKRGFHAHRTLYQFIIALHGSCEFHLKGSTGSFIFNLSSPDEGILIPPCYWREMHEFDPDTVLMVLASDDYKESDYIRNYEEYLNWLKAGSELNQIPYLDFTRELVPFKDIEKSLMEVVKSGNYINGPQVEMFEQEFAKFIGVKYAIGVGNGLDALTLCLESLGIGSNDEVIVCAAGFVATALSISRLGAKVVFVDSLPGGNMDPAKLQEAITEMTKAIIPTHLYGYPADIDSIAKIADERNIPIIEDACQAHGAVYKDRLCGSLGLAAAFSFYPTKNLGAIGDGGCLTTNNEDIARRVRELANYGSLKKYQHDIIGCNSRLDELQAAVLRLKLPYLNEWNERRKHLAATYEQELQGINNIQLLQQLPNTSPCYYAYVIRIKNGVRETLIDYLNKCGISINIHYPHPIHRQKCYQAQYEDKFFPEAESWAEENLSLPLSPSHSQSEINYVCKTLLEFFERKN